MKKSKEPTCVSVVEDTLRCLDDLVTIAMVALLVRMKTNQVSAVLCHLEKYGAAEKIVQEDGVWWIYTPKTDTRIRTQKERTPEAKPRKPRRQKMALKGA